MFCQRFIREENQRRRLREIEIEIEIAIQGERLRTLKIANDKDKNDMKHSREMNAIAKREKDQVRIDGDE